MAPGTDFVEDNFLTDRLRGAVGLGWGIRRWKERELRYNASNKALLALALAHHSSPVAWPVPNGPV